MRSGFMGLGFGEGVESVGLFGMSNLLSLQLGASDGYLELRGMTRRAGPVLVS